MALAVACLAACQRGTDPEGPTGERFASVLGWDGDRHAAIAYPDGSFRLRAGEAGRVGFAIADGAGELRWYNRSGYLPSLVTEFERSDWGVRIESFGDRVGPWLAIYSRVSMTDRAARSRPGDPGASSALVPLAEPPTTPFAPGETRHFDYAIVADRFGASDLSWPSAAELRAAGGWDERFAHMRRFWDGRLARIARIATPDRSLDDAYRAGFIYTHIVKDGLDLHVGENGYDRVFDHDAIGIAANLLTQGYLGEEARELLLRLPLFDRFEDATWKYPWPWALYLQKTDDLDTVRRRWPSIREAARRIGAARSGPLGTMKGTHAIDTTGLWTVDNWSALTGLWAYRYLAERLGEETEVKWAEIQYASLLAAVNALLSRTIATHGLDYLPASTVEPNTANRTRDPTDANWAAHFLFGRWAWDGYLLGAPQSGPGLDLIDATYEYGFARLAAAGLPPHTFGGYPGYSSGYNAGYAAAALRGERYRTEGVRAFQFMIASTQSGPYSWWENIQAPAPARWEGTHPAGGTGSCPHMWGHAVNSKVLLESLLAERFDGTLIVGRGLPEDWLDAGVRVENFPIAHGERIGVQVIRRPDRAIAVSFTGEVLPGALVDLPVFARAGVASVDGPGARVQGGRVLVPAGTRSVVVRLGPDGP